MSVTINHIEAELVSISVLDDEAAHSSLDALYILVLKAIASGDANAQQLAAAVLEGEKLDFSRWYA